MIEGGYETAPKFRHLGEGVRLDLYGSWRDLFEVEGTSALRMSCYQKR